MIVSYRNQENWSPYIYHEFPKADLTTTQKIVQLCEDKTIIKQPQNI